MVKVLSSVKHPKHPWLTASYLPRKTNFFNSFIHYPIFNQLLAMWNSLTNFLSWEPGNIRGCIFIPYFCNVFECLLFFGQVKMWGVLAVTCWAWMWKKGTHPLGNHTRRYKGNFRWKMCILYMGSKQVWLNPRPRENTNRSAHPSTPSSTVVGAVPMKMPCHLSAFCRKQTG